MPVKSLTFLLYTLSCIFTPLMGVNPFEIPFPEKRYLSNDDYILVQKMLREVDINPILHQLFSGTKPESTRSFREFLQRCERCLKQVIIDPERSWFPKAELFKIGNGGNRCIVTCASFETPLDGHADPSIRAKMADTIKEALEKTGFNGYLYKLTGGYPNPTGEEIRYAGVPYAFKIFTMLEAYQMGFTNVLWIDAACLPINDPSPIFKDIKQRGAAFLSFPPPDYFPMYIFPKTIQSLKEFTSVEVLSVPYVCTIVFGLNFDSPKVDKLVDGYYSLVRKGTPFFSCFPEEFVLTALLGMPELQSLHGCTSKDKLFTRSNTPEEDGPVNYEMGKNRGFYFYQRHH